MAMGLQRIEALLDRMGNELAALDAKRELIDVELLGTLREQHAELRGEITVLREAYLAVLRDAYHELAPSTTTVLGELKDRAGRVSTSMTTQARDTYDRLRTKASSSPTVQALKDSLADLGRGVAGAGRELARAVAAAVGRFRKPADTPPRIEAPPHAPNGGAAASNH
jgi:hypothetical protein